MTADSRSARSPSTGHGDAATARRRTTSNVRRRRTQLVLIASLALLAAPPAANASCIRVTVAQQRAEAQFIFDGRALDGPTPTGIQRFRVSRYLKGRGPTVVRVYTGYKRRADGTGSITSVSVVVARGERWRIFARRVTAGVLQTSQCDGSRRI